MRISDIACIEFEACGLALGSSPIEIELSWLHGQPISLMSLRTAESLRECPDGARGVVCALGSQANRTQRPAQSGHFSADQPRAVWMTRTITTASSPAASVIA